MHKDIYALFERIVVKVGACIIHCIYQARLGKFDHVIEDVDQFIYELVYKFSSKGLLNILKGCFFMLMVNTKSLRIHCLNIATITIGSRGVSHEDHYPVVLVIGLQEAFLTDKTGIISIIFIISVTVKTTVIGLANGKELTTVRS